MKRLLTNLAFIFLCSTALIAQADYRRGYIVKLNGDTLRGFINYQKEAVNNSTCNFKRFEIAIPVNYSPENLKAYGINGGKQYLSTYVNGRRFFIEYLVKGEISLGYLNRSGQHFFLLAKDEKPVELKSGRMTDENTGIAYERYRDFLKDKLVPGDHSVLIQESKLEQASLIELVSRYNEKLNYVYSIPKRPKDKNLIHDYNLLGTNKFHFGLIGGTSFYSFNPGVKKGNYFMTKCDFNVKPNPTGGVFFRWNISRARPNWSFQTNLMYQKVSLYGFSKRSSSTMKFVSYYDDVFIDFKEVRLAGMLNYSLLSGKYKLVPHAGVVYCYRNSPTYLHFFEELNTFYNIVKSSEYKDVKIKSGDIFALGGITLEYQISPARSFFLSADYQFGKGFFDIDSNKTLKNLGFSATSSLISLTFGVSL